MSLVCFRGGSTHPSTVGLFLGTGFLRLENEHRSNAAGYRRVGFVPLHFSTGHDHDYKNEKQHRGFSVLIEVAVVTIMVLGACVISVVAAQHATQKAAKAAGIDSEL